MPSLNFTMFVDQVLDGRKTQTIRAMRKHPIKVGDTLHLFTGMRRPCCRRLSPTAGVKCVQVIDIVMQSDANGYATIHMGESGELGVREIQALAERDGFARIDDFIDFFLPVVVGCVFHGQIIRWNYWGTPHHNTHN